MDLHIDRFFEEQNELIGHAVSYHLMIEGLLERLLVRTLANPPGIDLDRMMFARKLSKVHSLGLVDEPTFKILRKMNALRNKFAHQLGFSPTFEEVHALIVEAGISGVDFSDGVDAPDISYARSLDYDVAMLLNALFRNVFLDLAMAQKQDFWEGIIA